MGLIGYIKYSSIAINNNGEHPTKSRHSKLRYLNSLIVRRAITFFTFSTPLSVLGNK